MNPKDFDYDAFSFDIYNDTEQRYVFQASTPDEAKSELRRMVSDSADYQEADLLAQLVLMNLYGDPDLDPREELLDVALDLLEKKAAACAAVSIGWQEEPTL